MKVTTTDSFLEDGDTETRLQNVLIFVYGVCGVGKENIYIYIIYI